MTLISQEAGKKLLNVNNLDRTDSLRQFSEAGNGSMKRALVAGWCSFEQGHGTAGDLLAMELACEWLEQAGYSYDVALAPPFQGGLHWRSADPKDYSHVVFVCGPFEQGELEAKFLSRFGSLRLIGLDLSMLVPLDLWSPFDLLLERDSSAEVRPDIVFLSQKSRVPVVGVCLVEPYEGAIDHIANAAIERLVASNEMAVVAIDTRLDHNSTGLRSAAEIESLIARMDVVITTRLHGTVLALKNGVPAIPIDPMAGGAKIRRQLEKIGWPINFTADALTDETLQAAFDYCLTEAARSKAQECHRRALKMVQETRDEFIAALSQPDRLEHGYQARLARPASQEWILKKLAANTPAPKSQPLSWRLVEKGSKLVKSIAWWTLPTPIYNWLWGWRKNRETK